MNKKNKEPISVIMPMRNSETTVSLALKSLENQNYPINEVMVINDGSTDNSLKVTKDYVKKSKLKIKVINFDNSVGPGQRFNWAVKRAKSLLIVFMHSDCILPTEMELKKLTEPFRDEKNVVATFPTIRLSLSDWKKFDFWEKAFFAREAGNEIAGFTTKFDCVRKEAFLKVKGFDTKNFRVGGEDADLSDKLSKEGGVVKSKAKVSHIHFLGEGFTFYQYLNKRKQYARIYGRVIRVRKTGIIKNGLIFLVKPILALMPFLPYLSTLGFVLLVVYSFLYTKRMFMIRSTLTNPKIVLLPFVNILFLYLETFWTIEFFMFGRDRKD